MTYYLIKIALTTVLIVLISEISKRSTLMGAILASIPLVSVLAMIWLYEETRDVARLSALSVNIFWLVLPSLALFIALPLLLRQGMHFYPALAVALAITVACYGVMVAVLSHFGVKV
jgi:hypothetical protein